MNRRRAAKNKIIMMIFVKNNYPYEQVRENTDNKFVVYFHTIIYISFFQDFFNRYNSFFKISNISKNKYGTEYDYR